jgi:phage major head subunit gpT-like protein
MPAVSENFGDLLEPGLRKIFTEQYNDMPSMLGALFNMQSSSTSYEKDSSVGSFDDFPVFQGQVSYDEVYQGYDVTYTPVEFAKGFKVERKLFDDDLYNVIAKKPAGLSRAAKRSREKYGAQVFNNAFAGTGTLSVGGTTVLSNTEALSLCNASHTSTAPNVAVQSNSGTSALSATSVEATRVLMASFKDDRGNLISVIPDLILVPRNLEQKGFEIIASKGKVDSAENNENFHFGRYKLAVWDFLTDSNNWFLIDSTTMKDFLQWFDRVPLEFFQDKSFDTLIAKFASYMRFSLGWSDWRWIYGHNVTGA